MQNLTASTPFRSGHALAVALVTALLANVATHAVSALLLIAQRPEDLAVVSAPEGEASILRVLTFFVMLSNFVVYYAAVVLFCLWAYRAYANLPALGNPKQSLNGSPGWAVLSFFIPFVNLVSPYFSVRETWAKSDPSGGGGDDVAPRAPSAPWVLRLWWAFWIGRIIANVAARFVGRRANIDAEWLAAATWLDILVSVMTILAAVFAALVVLAIDRRQRQRSARISYAAPAAPPPPPIFTAPLPGTSNP